MLASLCLASIGGRAAVGTPLGWGGYFNGDTPPSATNLVSLHGSGLGLVGLRSDGTILAWPGTPQPPAGLSNVVEVSAGEYLFLARKSDGTVAAWGGGGHVAASSFLNPPAMLTNAIAIAAGSDHGVAWTSSKQLFLWGANQLGALNPPSRPLPAAVKGLAAGQQYTFFIDDAGRPFGWGANFANNLPAPAAVTNAVMIAAGTFGHCVGLRADGRVIAWGNNSHGQVAPIGTFLNDVTMVAVGHLHSLALRANGSVHVWGGRDTAAATPAPTNVRFDSIAAAGGASLGLTRAPVPIAPYTSIRIAAGTPVVLERAVIGSEPWSVQWFQNNEPIPGATNATLELPNPQNVQTGFYTVIARNEFGTNSSLPVEFMLNPAPPSFHIQPAHVAVAAGNTARLVGRARGIDPIGYQWLFRGLPLAGQTNATLEIPAANASHDGFYQLVASNEVGTATSSVAFLSTGAVLVSSEPLHVAVLPGRPVRLAAEIVTPAPTSLAWWKDGQPLAGANALQLELGPASVALAGNYQLVASNAFGVATSRVAHVHVRTRPVPLTKPHVAVHPYGDSIPFPTAFDAVVDARMTRSLRFGTFAMALDAAGRTWTWAASPQLLSAIAPPADLGPVESLYPGLVHALAREASGTLRGWIWNEGENYGQAFPPTGVNDAVEVASGDFFSIALQPDGSLRQWPIQGSAYPTVLRQASAVSIQGSTVMALHEDGSVIRWSPQYSWAANVSESLDAVAIWAGSAAGAILRSNGRVAWFSQDGTRDVPPLPGNFPVIDMGGDDDRFLALDPSGRVWQRPWNTNAPWTEWMPGLVGVSRLAPGHNGTYALTRAPFFASMPQPIDVRPGESTNLTADVRSPSPLRLQWLRGGQPIPGANGAALSIQQASYADDGDYSLVASNDDHSITSAPVRVSLLGPPLVLLPSRIVVRSGDDLALSSEIVGVGPISVGWRRDAVLLPGANAPILSIANAQSIHSGIYYLDATNAYGFSRGGPCAVTVLPSGLRWVRQPADGAWPEGGRVELMAEARGSEPVAWQWFQDGRPVEGGTNRVLVVAAAALTHAGLYEVTARNAWGSITSAPARVAVQPSAPVVPEVAEWRIGRSRQPFRWAPAIAGSPPLSIQWSRNGELLPGATNATLAFAALSESDAGTYTITIANPLGQAVSAPMDLVVRPGNPAGAAVAWSTAGPSAALGIVQDLALGPGFALGLRPDGSLAFWSPAPMPALEPPPGLDRVVAVAAGDTFAVALRDDGTVRAWGLAMNNPSVLVVPTNMGRAVGVAAGTAHAAALMADGSVRMWGSILGSTTNTPSNVSSLVHVAASGHQLAGIRANGTCVGWGGIGRATVPPSAVNVVSLALSPRHMVFTRTDGRVFSASSSITGALIPPATATNIVRVAVGNSHALGLRTNGTVLAWGSNGFGQLAVPSGLSNVVAVFAQGDLSAAITRAPGIVPPPAKLVAEEGAPLQIQATVTSDPPATLQWLRNGAEIPGATNALLASPALDGSYVLRASNAWQAVLAPAVVVRTVGPIEWRWHETGSGERALILRSTRASRARFLASTNLLDWTPTDPVDIPAEGLLWSPTNLPAGPAVFLRAIVE